jgi:site-specific DNA recombinase
MGTILKKRLEEPMLQSNSLLEELTCSRANGSADIVSAPVTAIAWARVSTSMQEERGLSIPEQLREIRQYAESRNIKIVDEFTEAVSAYQNRGKRTEFERMLVYVRTNRIPMILIHDFSRFSRDSAGAKALVRELRSDGIKVVSLNDPELDPESVAGVYMEAITFAKNEAYSREVAFHTRKGCRANIQTRDVETGWCYKNGGQPPFGYRSERLVRGQDKRGRPIIKSIWVLDDTVFNGRPVHEWARRCFVDLGATGASLAELRDFCNQNGIPGRRGAHWGLSTWNAILQPSVILQYCGYGVWNARTKEGRERPTSEWVTVPKAHPALLTEDEGRALSAARQRAKARARIPVNKGRSRGSAYVLSGGLFQCDRCGANMIGFRTSSGEYYVCGSQPYRRGLGCGPGVYVPRQEVETEVLRGLNELLNHCANPENLTRQVNAELKRLWEQSTGCSGEDSRAGRLSAIDAKIQNIRHAIEDGFMDASWANARLRELIRECDALTAQPGALEPPRLDAKTVTAYRRQIEKLMRSGAPAEKKRFLRAWLNELKLEPNTLSVRIEYRLPEFVMKSVVAGVLNK